MLCQNVWHSTRLSYNCQHYGRGLGKVPAGKSSLSGADGIPRELEPWRRRRRQPQPRGVRPAMVGSRARGVCASGLRKCFKTHFKRNFSRVILKHELKPS